MVPRLERIPFNVTGFLSRGNLLADCVPISQISRLGLNQHRQPIQFRGPREKAYGHAKYFAGGSLTFPGSGPKCKENRNWNNTKDNCVAAKKKKCENRSSKLTKWLCDRRTATTDCFGQVWSAMWLLRSVWQQRRMWQLIYSNEITTRKAIPGRCGQVTYALRRK